MYNDKKTIRKVTSADTLLLLYIYHPFFLFSGSCLSLLPPFSSTNVDLHTSTFSTIPQQLEIVDTSVAENEMGIYYV